MNRTNLCATASVLTAMIAAGCGQLDATTDDVEMATAALNAETGINCGGPQTVPVGTFVADTAFTGGSINRHPEAVIDIFHVVNAGVREVYQDARVGNFTYTLTGFLPNRSGTVRLHFAETFFSAAGKRRFNVAINNVTVLSNFDIFQAAGAKNRAVVRDIPANTSASGTYVVKFTSVLDQSLLSGIRGIAPKAPGQPCSSSADCSTGFCVTGVCCQTACSGVCDSTCAAGTGVCGAVPASARKVCGTVTDPETLYNANVLLRCDGNHACVGPTFNCGSTGVSCTLSSTKACCNTSASTIFTPGPVCIARSSCYHGTNNASESCKAAIDCPAGMLCCRASNYGFAGTGCAATCEAYQGGALEACDPTRSGGGCTGGRPCNVNGNEHTCG